MSLIILIDDNKELTELIKNNVFSIDKEISECTISFDLHELRDTKFKEAIPNAKIVIISHAVLDWHIHTNKIDLIQEIRELNPKVFLVTFSGRGMPLGNLGDLFMTRKELYNSEITKNWVSVLSHFYNKESTIITQDLSLVRNTISLINRNLVRQYASQPEELYNLPSYVFEEFVGDLFKLEGYEILLTKRTRDGGRDIYAYKTDFLAKICYIIECKRYDPKHKIGEPIIRNLYGVIAKERVSGGILVTTSYFTRPAYDFVKDIPHQLFLRDFTDITTALSKYKK